MRFPPVGLSVIVVNLLILLISFNVLTNFTIPAIILVIIISALALTGHLLKMQRQNRH